MNHVFGVISRITLSGYESEQTPEDGEVQASLARCCQWSQRVRQGRAPEQVQAHHQTQRQAGFFFMKVL